MAVFRVERNKGYTVIKDNIDYALTAALDTIIETVGKDDLRNYRVHLRSVGCYPSAFSYGSSGFFEENFRFVGYDQALRDIPYRRALPNQTRRR